MSGSPIRRRCEDCRRQFRVPSSTPDAVRCSSCRTDADPLPMTVVRFTPRDAEPISREQAERLAGADEPGPVEAAALREVTAAGRLEHPLGAAYLKLARELDRCGGNVAQQVAGRLVTIREAALAGAAREADGVDELLAQRRARRTAAQGA